MHVSKTGFRKQNGKEAEKSHKHFTRSVDGVVILIKLQY